MPQLTGDASCMSQEITLDVEEARQFHYSDGTTGFDVSFNTPTHNIFLAVTQEHKIYLATRPNSVSKWEHFDYCFCGTRERVEFEAIRDRYLGKPYSEVERDRNELVVALKAIIDLSPDDPRMAHAITTLESIERKEAPWNGLVKDHV